MFKRKQERVDLGDSSSTDAQLVTNKPGNHEGLTLLVFSVVTAIVAMTVLGLKENANRDDPAWQAGVPADLKADSPSSLIRPVNFAKALSLISRKAGANSRVFNMQLKPGSVDAGIESLSGGGHYILVNSKLRIETYSAKTDRSSSFFMKRGGGIVPSHIDSDAPMRILTEAQRRFKFEPATLKSFDLAAASPSNVGRSWTMSNERGDRFVATINGRHLEMK